MSDRLLGLYNKFEVGWKPGFETEGVDLDLFDLFVLDLDHDKFAKLALLEYKRSWVQDPPPDLTVVQPYTVRRTSDPTGKHANCRLFVLNATTDPHALKALRAYQSECQMEYPALFFDLGEMIRRNSGREKVLTGGVPEVQEVKSPSGDSSQEGSPTSEVG